MTHFHPDRWINSLSGRDRFSFRPVLPRAILVDAHSAVEVVAGASDDHSFRKDAFVTIFLALGLFAGLYLLWLLFNLATYALPVATGISLAFWMRDHDYGYSAAILGGFAAGIAVLAIGQFLFAVIRSPIVRLAIALLFAIPAGVAGYHAVRGVMGLALDPGTTLSTLSWIGAVVIAATAWTRLASFEVSDVAAPPAKTLQ